MEHARSSKMLLNPLLFNPQEQCLSFYYCYFTGEETSTERSSNLCKVTKLESSEPLVV